MTKPETQHRDIQPTFDFEDFRKYYHGCWLKVPTSIVPSARTCAREIAIRLGETDQKTVSGVLKKGFWVDAWTPSSLFAPDKRPFVTFESLLHWDYLKLPEIGWTDTRIGIPVFANRAPVRGVTKGVSANNVVLSFPRYLEILEEHFKVTPGMSDTEFVHNLFFPTKVTLQEAIASIRNDALFGKTLTTRAAVFVSPMKDRQDYPFIVFIGDLLSAKVSDDGKIMQIGDVDLTEVLSED